MTSNNIKVSIIVPIYNVEPYLKKCLNSLVNQTIANDIEIICINDCSPDNCLNILKEYQEKYGNRLIKIIDHQENKGVAISRNDGLAIAQGEYLGFVDPDDWVDLNFFEVLYNSGVETGADIAKGNYKKVKDGKISAASKQNNIIAKNIVSFYGVGWWSAIYNNKMIKENSIIFPDICNGEDDVFLTKAKYYSNRIKILDGTFYYYLDREKSLTKNYSEKRAYSIIEYTKIMSNFINSVNISKDDYIFYTNRIINELINVFNMTKYDSKSSVKNNIIETMFNIYDDCKYKKEYYEKYCNDHTAYLIAQDYPGFKKYLLTNYHFKTSFKIFKYFTILKIKSKDNGQYFYLFNFIPILKIYKEDNFLKHYKIFNLIPILTIKDNYYGGEK